MSVELLALSLVPDCIVSRWYSYIILWACCFFFSFSLFSRYWVRRRDRDTLEIICSFMSLIHFFILIFQTCFFLSSAYFQSFALQNRTLPCTRLFAKVVLYECVYVSLFLVLRLPKELPKEYSCTKKDNNFNVLISLIFFPSFSNLLYT